MLFFKHYLWHRLVGRTPAFVAGALAIICFAPQLFALPPAPPLIGTHVHSPEIADPETQRHYSAHLIFPVLAAVLGLWIGGQFPVASHLWARDADNQARSAALLYAADLLGAAGGALVSGTLLVPVWGVTTTCWLMAALAMGASVLVLRAAPAGR